MCDKDWFKIKMSKKLKKDGHHVRKDYFVLFTYSSRSSICHAVLQFNDGAHKGKALYLLKELKRLKHSCTKSTKNAAACK